MALAQILQESPEVVPSINRLDKKFLGEAGNDAGSLSRLHFPVELKFSHGKMAYHFGWYENPEYGGIFWVAYLSLPEGISSFELRNEATK